MGIQDMTAGGFTGKVGELIGQRYKDKYVVRTYVKPRNPRTPKQQQNRVNFANAVRLAQSAMAQNAGADFWQSPKLTEFTWRVQTARKRLLAGATPEQALPLYPDGYLPAGEYTVTDATYTFENGVLTAHIPPNDTINLQEVTMRFKFFNPANPTEWEVVEVVTSGENLTSADTSAIAGLGERFYNDPTATFEIMPTQATGAPLSDINFFIGSQININDEPRPLMSPDIPPVDNSQFVNDANDTISIDYGSFGLGPICLLEYIPVPVKIWGKWEAVNTETGQTYEFNDECDVGINEQSYNGPVWYSDAELWFEMASGVYNLSGVFWWTTQENIGTLQHFSFEIPDAEI